MKPTARTLACIGFAAVLAAGCAGDISKQLVSDPNLQEKILGTISANEGLAGQMADRLLAGDGTRAMLVEKLMGNGDAAQGVMLAVAKNSSMLDGVIGLAVQDSSTRDRLMTLFKGMQMAGAK